MHDNRSTRSNVYGIQLPQSALVCEWWHVDFHILLLSQKMMLCGYVEEEEHGQGPSQFLTRQ